MNQVEREAVRLTAMLAATEEYAAQYSKAPEQHAAMIKALQAELQLILQRFFKNMAAQAKNYINRAHYEYQLSQNKLSTDRLDYDVSVIVNDNQIDDNDG